jgi:SPP1 gp7 family putative phage head morphogenesis protein
MAAKRRKPKRAPRAHVDNADEAVKWFRNRVPMTKDKWLKLDRRAREKAFTVANVAQLDLVADIHKALTKAIAKGETLEAFKKRVAGELTRAWGEERPWHVETIFRTNVQLAYSRGRDVQQRSQGSLAARPYWLFSAILDDRTTAHICRPAHGTLLPADHKWWSTHTPPLHHRCRSLKRAITTEQAEELGITKRPPKLSAATGFGVVEKVAWQPDLSEYPAELVKKYRRKR